MLHAVILGEVHTVRRHPGIIGLAEKQVEFNELRLLKFSTSVTVAVWEELVLAWPWPDWLQSKSSYW